MTNQITEADLKELEELCEKAMEGPWEYRSYPNCLIEHHVQQVMGPHMTYTIATPAHSSPGTRYNMEFIAASRAAIPKLIAEIRDLRAALIMWENNS